MDETGLGSSCDNPVASVSIRLLHGSVMYDNEITLEDAVGHLRKESGRYEDLSYLVPLQNTDERIRFDHGSPERLRRHHFPGVSTRHDD
jgi:hypothetical protein